LGTVQIHHRPHAQPHHLDSADPQCRVLDPGVRRHLRDDRRRPGLLHHGPHPVRVPLRLPGRRDGLCRRAGPGARRDPAGLHPAAAAGVQESGELPMSSTLSRTAPSAATPHTPAARSGRARTSPRRWLLVAGLAVLALLMMFPLYWMVVSALTPGGQSQSSEFYLWPAEPTFANFTEVFSTQPVWRWIANSLFIAVVTTTISACVSLGAGYALPKFNFWGKGLLYAAFPISTRTPIQATLAPSCLVVARLGLVASPSAVILPTAFDVVGIFIARQFMLSVPDALVEAARVDGAGEYRAFFSVVLPTCGPLIGVLVILAFMARWNDFLWPLVVLQGNENLTVPVALSTLTNNPAFASPWGAVMAVATVTVLPILAVFLAFQRQFVQGISSTGIK